MALDQLILARGGFAEHVPIPLQLITGTGVQPRPRVRVDVAETSFMEGREFRGYYEYSVPTGSTIAMRFVGLSDFILHEQSIVLNAGAIRFSAATGGTPGGTFTAQSAIGKNRMASRPTPYYTSTAVFSTGGTHTGGAEVEVITLSTANATAMSSTIAVASDERGLPAGTYYLRIQNTGTGTATGVYTLMWEEVVQDSLVITTT